MSKKNATGEWTYIYGSDSSNSSAKISPDGKCIIARNFETTHYGDDIKRWFTVYYIGDKQEVHQIDR